MKLIFDNIVYSLQASGGVSRFWSRITEPYLNEAVFIERNDASSNIYRRIQQLDHRRPDHHLTKLISRYINFSERFSNDPYIFHSSYYRVNSAIGAKNVTTIHDLMYERFGSGVGSRFHIIQKRHSLKAADCIVCVSEHTRRDLYECYPFTREKRVIVIPNGVDTAREVISGVVSEEIRRIGDRGKYFLYVGHRGSCKGFDRVYSALKLCGTDWRCVVVGAELKKQELAAIKSAGVSKHVVAVGRVSDPDLNYLYNRAQFFFFPSLYEGFGIPPLEAMQQGCPVLASNRTSVPEVVGDAGVLFDPDDLDSLADGINRITSSDVRQIVIERGRQRARSYSWGAAVEAYRSLYKDLLYAQ